MPDAQDAQYLARLRRARNRIAKQLADGGSCDPYASARTLERLNKQIAAAQPVPRPPGPSTQPQPADDPFALGAVMCCLLSIAAFAAIVLFALSR